MAIQIKESVLIKTLDNQFHNFYIDETKNLILNKYNQNNEYIESTKISNENILDFSASIDRKNKIHLIYLLKDGSLIYSIYYNEKWSNHLIGKLNLKSNIYKELKLYIFNNEIYIFYAYTNLINENIWTIEEIIGSKNGWNKKRIVNVLSEKNFSPFCIDFDKLGNIHMVYRAKDKNSNQIYYTFYNIFVKKWNQLHTKISDSMTNNSFPYLFVDSQNNIHILWYSLVSEDCILNYKNLLTIGQNRDNWEKVKLPLIKNSISTPIMFEYDNNLNILYLKDNNIFSLISKDNGRTWYEENKTTFNTKTIWLVKYSSNSTSDAIQGKINDIYCIIDNNILYLNNFNNSSIKKSVDSSKKKVTKELGLMDLKDLEENLVQINMTLEKILASINNIENSMTISKKTIKNNDTFSKIFLKLFK